MFINYIHNEQNIGASGYRFWMKSKWIFKPPQSQIKICTSLSIYICEYNFISYESWSSYERTAVSCYLLLSSTIFDEKILTCFYNWVLHRHITEISAVVKAYDTVNNAIKCVSLCWKNIKRKQAFMNFIELLKTRKLAIRGN